MSKPDGGPAFPSGLNQDAEFDRQFCYSMEPGMSLRAWLAGQAPPCPSGFADTTQHDKTCAMSTVDRKAKGCAFNMEESAEVEAKWCVVFADAVIAELEKP